MSLLNELEHQASRKQADDIALLAAELYSSLLAVEVPDPKKRGIVNFDKSQAFDLVAAVFADAVKGGNL